MGLWNLIVRFFQGGGDFMYPIAVVFVVGAAIAIERYIYLTHTAVRNRSLWNEIVPHAGAGQLPPGGAGHLEVRVGDRAHSSTTAWLVSPRRGAGMTSRRPMEESLMEVVPRLEKRTHYLATFANLATLLGLLGTVMGLIRAFAAVATINPAEKANLLSASISVAMNCTAFGLMTAVPLLFVHAFLQTKTTELIDSLEMASVKFLNAITERQSPSAGRGGLTPNAAHAQSRLESIVSHASLLSNTEARASSQAAG